MALGYSRGGIFGSIAAWVGFTLPSAILLTVFALSLGEISDPANSTWIHGLKIAAVAVVGQAVTLMARRFCPDFLRIGIALVTLSLLYCFPSIWTQLGVIVLGATIGALLLKTSDPLPRKPLIAFHRPGHTKFFLGLFVLLLIGLPLVANLAPPLKLFDRFYRTGALVFGGGHVVLPFLKTSILDPGWMTESVFMAGYGAAQAIPGPLFAFAAYLGASSTYGPSGFLGAALCLTAIFLPSFLLILGVLPIWEKWRTHSEIKNASAGINAAVVGLIVSAFIHPVWTSAIFSVRDLAIAVIAFAALMTGRIPAWAVVLFCALGSALF